MITMSKRTVSIEALWSSQSYQTAKANKLSERRAGLQDSYRIAVYNLKQDGTEKTMGDHSVCVVSRDILERRREVQGSQEITEITSLAGHRCGLQNFTEEILKTQWTVSTKEDCGPDASVAFAKRVKRLHTHLPIPILP